jgi:hypothetical protein
MVHTCRKSEKIILLEIMPVNPIAYQLIQLQTRRAFLVANLNKLQQHINEIDESIRIISELFNGQLHPRKKTSQPPDIVTESFHVFHQRVRRDPDPNSERIEFRLG